VRRVLGFLWFNAFPAKVFLAKLGSAADRRLARFGWRWSPSKSCTALIAFVFRRELMSSWIQRIYFQRSGGQARVLGRAVCTTEVAALRFDLGAAPEGQEEPATR